MSILSPDQLEDLVKILSGHARKDYLDLLSYAEKQSEYYKNEVNRVLMNLAILRDRQADWEHLVTVLLPQNEPVSEEAEYKTLPEPGKERVTVRRPFRKKTEVTYQAYTTWYNLVGECFKHYPPDHWGGLYFDISTSTAGRLRMKAKNAGLITRYPTNVKLLRREGITLEKIIEELGVYKYV